MVRDMLVTVQARVSGLLTPLSDVIGIVKDASDVEDFTNSKFNRVVSDSALSLLYWNSYCFSPRSAISRL